MKQYTVRYLPAAQRDLLEIMDFLLGKSLVVAETFISWLDHAEENLSQFPNIGVLPKDTRLHAMGYRMLILGNYLLFYIVASDDHIEVRRIVHGKRKYEFLFECEETN